MSDDQDKSNDFLKSINAVLSNILAENQSNIEESGKFDVCFSFPGVDRNIKLIITQDFQERSLTETEMLNGVEYSYDSRTYSVNDEEGKIRIIIKNILNPQDVREITVPTSIDAQSLVEIMSNPSPSGWERGFGLVPVQANIH